MAAALGLGPEGRLALLAVTSALEAAGLEEPLDVAFVGNGDTLPPGTITQILEGCDVPGAEDVLKGMFRVAREGMEGSIAIRARGLTRAAARPPREAWVSQSQEGRLGNKAEARVLTALAVPAVTSKRARRAAKTETSLRSRETGQFEEAMNRCFSLLQEMGPRSPRFDKIFNAPGGQADAIKKLQTNAFTGSFSTARGLDGARRRLEAYLCSMAGLGLDPYFPPEWELAALIADQASKSKSGPRRMLQALAWAERAYGLTLGLTSPLVQAQRATWTAGRADAPPKQAKMATTDMLRMMEEFVFNAPTHLLRCWAVTW